MYLEEYIAGSYEKNKDYKSFLPTKINRQWEWRTPEVNILLEKASMELGSLKSYSELLPI